MLSDRVSDQSGVGGVESTEIACGLRSAHRRVDGETGAGRNRLREAHGVIRGKAVDGGNRSIALICAQGCIATSVKTETKRRLERTVEHEGLPVRRQGAEPV